LDARSLAEDRRDAQLGDEWDEHMTLRGFSPTYIDTVLALVAEYVESPPNC